MTRKKIGVKKLILMFFFALSDNIFTSVRSKFILDYENQHYIKYLTISKLCYFVQFESEESKTSCNLFIL